jgi:flagellar export protein FliJ
MFSFDKSRDLMRVSHTSKFSTVLKVRRIQEKKSQTELHQLQIVHAQEEATLADIKQTQETALSDAVRSMRMKATDAQTSRAFIRKLSDEIQDQSKKVNQLESLKESKREELLARTQNKNMIEKLDDKLQSEQAKENDRKEQRLIDVLAQRIRTDRA